MNKKIIFLLLALSSLHPAFAQKVKITNSNVVQDNNYSGRGNDNEEILEIEIVASGKKPVALKTLKMNMNGTTDIHDVEEIKIYRKSDKAPFDPRNPLKNALLSGKAKPQSGNFLVPLHGTLAADTTRFLVTYKVKETAREGNKLDASVSELSTKNETYRFAEGNPDGAREILLRRTLVYAPNDYGSKNYRIPAIVTAADSALVIVTDKRKHNSTDLPEDIDLVVNRSVDGGKTWSQPLTIAQGQGKGKGYGDALIVKTKSGKLITLFVGGPGLWGSTPDKPQRVYMVTSIDNGKSWTSPRDITYQIYGYENNDPVRSKWISLFIGSGQGLTTRGGRTMCVLVVREPGKKGLHNYALYSDDEGENWNVSQLAIENGDEAKVIELNNGDILMSSRQPEPAGNRLWAISKDGGVTWGERNSWSEIWGARCDADIVRLTSTQDGYDKDRILHTMPNSERRKNVTLWISYDEAKTWPIKKTIAPNESAYSSIAILPDGTIGVYLEEDERFPYRMYFLNFSLHWLTDGRDKYIPPKR